MIDVQVAPRPIKITLSVSLEIDGLTEELAEALSTTLTDILD